MQAKPLHTFPTHIPQPRRQNPVQQKSLSLPTIPRAISISVPDTRVTIPAPPSIDIDDSITAFWDYQFLFVSQRYETTQPITLRIVDGSIPTDFPSGTYYLTGPGLFADDHGSTVHPLDGHGYLRAFTIDNVNKKVKYMAKYIKTEAQVEEHDPKTNTWRFTHRGPFSVLKGGRKVGNTKVMKNVANTSVLRWGEKLLCMWEGGDPYEIESRTLDTIGRYNMMDECDLEGYDKKYDVDIWEVAARLLKPLLYGVFKMPPRRLLSHYKVDSRRNRLLTVSCNAEDMLLPRSNFIFSEYDSNFKLVQKQEFKIPDHMMIHDWAFTDTHYIIFANRIKLDVLGSMEAVCGISPMISALKLNPSKSTSPIYLLPRFPNKSKGKERDWRVPIEAPSQLWLIHVGNAFEINHANGNLEIQIVASACSYQWFNFRKLFGYDWQNHKLDPSMMNIKGGNELLPHIIQVSIKLDSDYNCQECNVKPMQNWKKSSDFPIINPSFSGKKNRYLYAATTLGSRKTLPSFPFDTVVKLDLVNDCVQTWTVESRRFIGEPIFVPKGHDEDDGYLLVVEYAVSMQRCYLVILNPKRIGLTNAVVARLEIPRHLNFPMGFHGFWAAK
ncbi:PREDICTED: carotenoid cleavage dioxygenase 7, chloroplastic [Lupinus angustifolius]|uniref:carotenoid cleavage dioxygenase 7, chloroplastic n=1 Tax=Lupinus angustifolius TaxID=3871 RepID=UPI00092F3F3C|nr:PREDICTED: carotenoid cleavage dioxygenase 7, chloroplastic [Lupinus angustifolius]